MRRQNPARPRIGISIIELLVVLAVIAVLAGILLPMLGRGRQSSAKAVCASNLKQFSSAFTMYAHDWSGYWPAPGGLSGDRTYWSQSGTGGLNGYVRQQGIKTIWCCPLLTSWSGKYPPRSYSMNSYLRTPSDIEYPKCLRLLCGIDTNKIRVPEKTILLFEGIPLTDGFQDSLDYIYRCANWSRVKGFIDNLPCAIEPGKPWHERVSNYLYCDGHIAARPPGKRISGELSTGKEMYEWYVDKGRYMEVFRRDWSTQVPWE